MCNNCDFEQDFEQWYNITDFDSEDIIRHKLDKKEICPKCNNKLDRWEY